MLDTSKEDAEMAEDARFADQLHQEELNDADESKVDAAFSRFKKELILWLVGSVTAGVLVNHFWR
jgi:hypothetical protein